MTDKVLFQLPTCTSLSNPTLVCIWDSLALTLDISSLSYYQVGSPLDITINFIYNPSSVAQVGPIYASGQLGGTEVTSAQISIPAIQQHDQLRMLTFATTYQSADKFTLTITFSFARFSMLSDSFELIFPSELTRSTTATDYTITGPNTPSPLNLDFTCGTGSVCFYPFNGEFISEASVNITIINIPRPRACIATSPFTLNSYRSGLFLKDSSSCCSIDFANRLTLLSSTPLLSSSSRLAHPVTYTLNLTTAVIQLIASDQLKIEFPSEFGSQISSSNGSLCGNVSVALTVNPGSYKAPSCAVYANTLVLSNFLQNDLSGN